MYYFPNKMTKKHYFKSTKFVNVRFANIKKMLQLSHTDLISVRNSNSKLFEFQLKQLSNYERALNGQSNATDVLFFGRKKKG